MLDPIHLFICSWLSRAVSVLSSLIAKYSASIFHKMATSLSSWGIGMAWALYTFKAVVLVASGIDRVVRRPSSMDMTSFKSWAS